MNEIKEMYSDKQKEILIKIYNNIEKSENNWNEVFTDSTDFIESMSHTKKSLLNNEISDLEKLNILEQLSIYENLSHKEVFGSKISKKKLNEISFCVKNGYSDNFDELINSGEVYSEIKYEGDPIPFIKTIRKRIDYMFNNNITLQNIFSVNKNIEMNGNWKYNTRKNKCFHTVNIEGIWYIDIIYDSLHDAYIDAAATCSEKEINFETEDECIYYMEKQLTPDDTAYLHHGYSFYPEDESLIKENAIFDY